MTQKEERTRISPFWKNLGLGRIETRPMQVNNAARDVKPSCCHFLAFCGRNNQGIDGKANQFTHVTPALFGSKGYVFGICEVDGILPNPGLSVAEQGVTLALK